jgi:hypothetical protein
MEIYIRETNSIEFDQTTDEEMESYKTAYMSRLIHELRDTYPDAVLGVDWRPSYRDPGFSQYEITDGERGDAETVEHIREVASDWAMANGF